MAVIRPYESQVSAEAPLPGTSPERLRATPEDFGADVGAQVTRLGGALSNAGDVLYKSAETNEVSNLETQFATLRANSTIDLQQRALKAQPGEDVTSSFNDDLQNKLAGIQSNLTTNAGQRFFNLHSAELTGSMLVNATSLQTRLTGEKTKLNYQDALQTNANTLYNDPTQFGSILSATTAALNDPSGPYAAMPPDARIQLASDTKTTLATSSVEGLIKMAPDLAVKQLAGGVWNAYLPAHTMDTLSSRAGAAVREQQVQARGAVASAYQDNLAAIERTGAPAVPLSNGQIMAAYPDKGGAMLADLARARALYTSVQNSALTSPEEDQATLTKFNPSGEGFAQQAHTQDVFQQVLQQKYSALQKDPAAYVVSVSPQIASMFNDAAQDPKKLPTAAGALDAAYDHLGVPDWQRNLLPKDQANTVVQSILSQPPEQRAGAIADMAQKYGPDLWPRVMGDLVKAKLPVAYNVLAAVPDSASRTALADAIGTGKKPMRDAIPPDDAKAIDRAIETDADMTTLRRSFGYASGGLQTYDEIQGAVKLMAYRFSDQMSPADAAKRAIASVTRDKYDFTDDGARAPKGMGSQVQTAADQLLSSLTADHLAVPANPSGAKLTDAQLQNIALSAAKRGNWITNERDDGLARLDVNHQPVMLSNGDRLELPFSSIKKGAASSGILQRLLSGFGNAATAPQ